MLIHGNQMNVNAVDFYSTAQQEKAATAQRAAAVRRKLLRCAPDIDGSASPEETLLIGDWLDSRRSRDQNVEERDTHVPGKYSDFV